MGNDMMYAVAAMAILVLGFALFGMPSAQQTASILAQDAGTGGACFSQQAQVPPECGDINNPQNLQHLSHHPDRFQACYRIVDPAKFKAAVGGDVTEFIR